MINNIIKHVLADIFSKQCSCFKHTMLLHNLTTRPCIAFGYSNLNIILGHTKYYHKENFLCSLLWISNTTYNLFLNFKRNSIKLLSPTNVPNWTVSVDLKGFFQLLNIKTKIGFLKNQPENKIKHYIFLALPVHNLPLLTLNRKPLWSLNVNTTQILTLEIVP